MLSQGLWLCSLGVVRAPFRNKGGRSSPVRAAQARVPRTCLREGGNERINGDDGMRGNGAF